MLSKWPTLKIFSGQNIYSLASTTRIQNEILHSLPHPPLWHPPPKQQCSSTEIFFIPFVYFTSARLSRAYLSHFRNTQLSSEFFADRRSLESHTPRARGYAFILRIRARTHRAAKCMASSLHPFSSEFTRPRPLISIPQFILSCRAGSVYLSLARARAHFSISHCISSPPAESSFSAGLPSPPFSPRPRYGNKVITAQAACARVFIQRRARVAARDRPTVRN